MCSTVCRNFFAFLAGVHIHIWASLPLKKVKDSLFLFSVIQTVKDFSRIGCQKNEKSAIGCSNRRIQVVPNIATLPAIFEKIVGNKNSAILSTKYGNGICRAGIFLPNYWQCFRCRQMPLTAQVYINKQPVSDLKSIFSDNFVLKPQHFQSS